MPKKILAYIPLALIVLAMLAIYFSGVYRDLDFQVIKAKHTQWKTAIHFHPVYSALLFIGIYIVSVCLILPDSTLLSLLAGFLFPFPLAVLYIVFSETVGAMIFFWATRIAFYQTTANRQLSPYLIRLQKKIYQHQVSYLLFFRFSHLLPFWMINLGSACLNIRTWTFFWTTLIGVLPLAIVLTQGGSGFSYYIEKNQIFTLNELFNTQMKFALLFLGLLALAPVLYGKFRKKQ